MTSNSEEEEAVQSLLSQIDAIEKSSWQGKKQNECVITPQMRRARRHVQTSQYVYNNCCSYDFHFSLLRLSTLFLTHSYPFFINHSAAIRPNGNCALPTIILSLLKSAKSFLVPATQLSCAKHACLKIKITNPPPIIILQ